MNQPAAEGDSRLTGLAPIHTPGATLLLLGSMPSAESLRLQQYYGHPQNHFWKLVFAMLEEDCPAAYATRINRLQARGIALWDSIHSCTRPGSLDKNIKHAQPNPLGSFIEAHPHLRAVGFNGTMAQKVHDAHFPRREGLVYMLLPSSSPVPRRQIRRLEDKQPAWQSLQMYLD